MAKFKIGDRVRIVRANVCKELIGRQATIISPPIAAADPLIGEWVGHEISVDGLGPHFGFHKLNFPPDALEPLTPPNISEWADKKVKQVTKPEPVVPEVKKEAVPKSAILNERYQAAQNALSSYYRDLLDNMHMSTRRVNRKP